MQELPSEACELRQATLAAVNVLGADGSTFTGHDVEMMLPPRNGRVRRARRILFDLARQGALERVNPASSVDHAAFKVRSEPPPATEPALFYTFNLPLQLPRTYDGLWALMNWLDRERGGFSMADVVRLVDGKITNRIVEGYVRALDRAGAITVAVKIGSARIYRVDRRFVETPRIKADGTLLQGPRRAATMWRSMKMLTYFTAQDLASAASMPDLDVSVEQAQRYAAALSEAGYLITRQRGDEAPVYRLKTTMNTGPAAPEVLRAHLVWDPNTCRVANATARAEEVRP